MLTIPATSEVREDSCTKFHVSVVIMNKCLGIPELRDILLQEVYKSGNIGKLPIPPLSLPFFYVKRCHISTFTMSRTSCRARHSAHYKK